MLRFFHYLSNILLSGLFVTLILLGFACALISGYIEYNVFDELYPKGLDFVISIPLVIVVAFEVAKVSLIVFDKVYMDTGNTSYIKARIFFRGIRYFLIFISICATLVFSFHNLDNPEYENEVNKEKERINEKYENLIQKVNNSFSEQGVQLTSQYDSEITKQEKIMEYEKTRLFKNSLEFRGPNYNEAKSERDKFVRLKDSEVNKITEKKNDKIAEILDEKDKEFLNIQEELRNSSRSDNKYLNSTLSIVSQAINDSTKYTRTSYIIMIIIISLLVSFGIESLIFVTFLLVGITSGNFFSDDLESAKEEVNFEKATKRSKRANEAKLKNEKQRFDDYVDSLTKRAEHADKKVYEKINETV